MAKSLIYIGGLSQVDDHNFSLVLNNLGPSDSGTLKEIEVLAGIFDQPVTQYSQFIASYFTNLQTGLADLNYQKVLVPENGYFFSLQSPTEIAQINFPNALLTDQVGKHICVYFRVASGELYINNNVGCREIGTALVPVSQCPVAATSVFNRTVFDENTNRITISWNPFQNVSSYQLFLISDGKPASPVECQYNLEQLAELPANTTQYAWQIPDNNDVCGNSLSDKPSYRFLLRAVNSNTAKTCYKQFAGGRVERSLPNR